MDQPYRVEADHRHTSQYTTTPSYVIVRTGEGNLCWIDDVVFAHRIVDLLNHEENDVEGR